MAAGSRRAECVGLAWPGGINELCRCRDVAIPLGWSAACPGGQGWLAGAAGRLQSHVLESHVLVSFTHRRDTNTALGLWSELLSRCWRGARQPRVAPGAGSSCGDGMGKADLEIFGNPAPGREAATMLSQQPPPAPSTPVPHGAGVPVLVPPWGHGHGGARHRLRALEKPALKQGWGATGCQAAPGGRQRRRALRGHIPVPTALPWHCRPGQELPQSRGSPCATVEPLSQGAGGPSSLTLPLAVHSDTRLVPCTFKRLFLRVAECTHPFSTGRCCVTLGTQL